MLKRSIMFLAAVVILSLSSQLAMAATALDWLASQQNQTTNLLDSYEGDGSNVAYSYDQAVAIIAFTSTNDLARARKILDKMAAIQNADGSWYFGYDATNGAGFANQSFKDTGNNSYMIMAINYYTGKTGDTTYINAAKKCADFLLTLQDTNTASETYGAVRGRPEVTWYGTEHNHNAYSALYYLGEITNDQNYKNKGVLVYNWLANKMWNDAEGRLYAGYNDTRKFLDPNSYAVLNLGLTGTSGQDFTRSVPWIYSNMHVVRTFNGQTLDGFDYDATLDAIWFEGTEQMALAYEIMGSSATAAYYHNQVAKAQSANGGMPCSSGGGSGWPNYMTQNCVAGTSWFVFSSQSPRVNPFKPFMPVPDTTPPVINNVMASNAASDSVMITWTTDEPSTSQVYYGTTTALGSSSPLNTNNVLSHTINLTGLHSSTTYYYQVASKDLSNNTATSGNYIFSTLSSLLTKDYASTGIILTKGSTKDKYYNLTANDSTYVKVAAAKAGTLYYTDWYAKAVIAESPAKVSKLTVTYDGHYSASRSQELSLYNFATSTWMQINAQTIGTTDTTITFTTTSTSYISSTGEIRLRVYATNKSKHTCYGDFVKFSIEYSGSGALASSPANNAPSLNNSKVKVYNNVFNPAKGENARIDYSIDNDGQVTIKIYNIAGELVRTLVDESKPAGTYSENWNGKNDDGQTVASGVYLCFTEAPGIETIKKIAIIK